ncbi:MAG TPA: hypothetical protein VKU19_29635 [Bryobacteraceae bacterium]|nr:hypothetical protein [Bryobacteraceae bacterium]
MTKVLARPHHRVLLGFCALTLILILAPSPVSGQQTYVTRFDAFGGYAFLDSPHVNMFENGFATQAGVRVKRWLSLGVDYTFASGDLKLTPNLLTTQLQQQLGAQLGGLVAQGIIPPTYSLSVAAHSHTQTFAAGPQLAYRHMRKVTLFLRPVFMGVIHESATPNPTPTDPIATAIVKELAPSGKKTDNVIFIGFGGGVDLILSKHISWRTQADLVYDHLFNDLLQDGRFTTRFSIGPAFNFGRNIAD